MSTSSVGLPRHDLHGTKPITITVAEAKRLSGLGATTLWGLIKDGRLQTVTVGRRRLVVLQSLEAMLAPRGEGRTACGSRS
jgi:hypothetical protein